MADRLARRRKTSRSAVLREGVRALAENQARDTEEVARRERQRVAIRGIREIARHLGDWPATEIIHAWRYRLEGKKP